MKIIHFFAVIIVLTTTACGQFCSKEGYFRIVNPTLDKWYDAVEVADHSSKITMGSSIAELQSILREYKDIDVPECYSDAHLFVMAYMDRSITCYFWFVEGRSTVERCFNYADMFFDYAMDELP